MAPRGRPRKRTPASESGVSVADTEPDNESSSSSRPRRSRLPKRYFDEDYSPPPSKKRAVRRSPSDTGEEEDIKLPIPTPTARALTQTPKSSATKTPKPRGRPKKAPTPCATTRRKSKRIEEEVIYMDEDSEDNESSDDEYEMPPDEQDEYEEELELNDIKVEKVEEEEEYCPWIDDDPASLPKLDLPESSRDIPLPNHATFDAIEVYEILRSYHRTLRITPFTFEDFCAALISRNNSCIMAEVHIALLRICMKSDEEEQTQYSFTDTNNSINIMIQHLEVMTYGEVIRQYIEAYPFADESVREAINADNYPYVGYESKIIVLLFMCYRFLYSSEYKKVVTNVGKFQNDDNCRVCGKSSGRIVGCTQCEASFHVECSRLNPFPDVLVCNICNSNNVRGVTNALPLGEYVEREPLRSQPIGRDRYGRYYWFVCRRLIVQSLDETEIHYYSTPPQLYQLLQRLDRNYYEKTLCETIKNRIDEFLEQMTLTIEMTSEKREAAIESAIKRNAMSFEYVESVTPQIYLHKDSMKRMAAILRDCAEKAAIKKEVKDEEDGEDDETTRSSGPLEIISPPENSVLPDSMIGIFDGRLINTFWSGGATQEDLVTYFLEKMDIVVEPLAYWRMGDESNDQSFMQYYNYYSRNEMAESAAVRKRQADKKKYMSARFAMIDNFEWVVAKDRQFYGNSVLHTKFVSWTLSRIAKKIPPELMHRRWLEMAKAFDVDISTAENYKQITNCLLKLDLLARKTIFITQWWSGLGQTKMERTTADQREAFNKEQQRIKKLELDSVAKDLDESFIRVNYSKPKWPNTYILRQKGEAYRNAGKGAMGGWQWVSNKYAPRIVSLPGKPTLPLSVASKTNESTANRRARNLELLVSKINRKLVEKEAKANAKLQAPNFQLVNKCYAPGCRTQANPNLQNPNCYSTSCRDGYLALAKQRYDEDQTAKRGVLGEDKPWPIPKIHSFATNHGKSLFILPKNSRVLRQMILTAGCQQVYMPGFLPAAKSNLMIWPYQAPRPTVDLCWRWQTLNARSLHAVALQLKIMWSCIKWNEFDPDDTHPDRRVVIDTPTHDERRRIVNHKEMPPYGQYERYELEIEIIPLFEEHEEEDDSWTSRRDRNSDASQRTSTRKKRPTRGVDNRRATAIRKEWVDGVTLKVFEIKDYWKAVRLEAERMQKRKIELMKKQAKEADRQKILALAARQKILSPQQAPLPRGGQQERVSVPYMPSSRRDQGNGGRYLEKYNASQIPPRSTPLATPAQSSSYQTQQLQQQRFEQQHQLQQQQQQQQQQPHIRHVQPNPVNYIRKVSQTSSPSYTQYEYRQQQQPSTSRAAAGADGSVYRASPMQHGGQMGYAQPMRQTSNGYHWQEGALRGGGRQIASSLGVPRQRAPQHHQQPLRPFGEPVNDMRRAMPVAEEAVAAAAVSDGDDQPPQIPRYDRTVPGEQVQQRPAQPIRQVYNVSGGGQQMVRTIPANAAPGSKGNFIVVKSADGMSQKLIVRPAGPTGSGANMGEQQQQVYRTAPEYPPGTVLNTRLVAVRPNTQQFRPMYNNSATGPRYVRVQNPTVSTRPSDQQVVRRVVPASSQRAVEYVEDQGQSPHMRYVLQGNPMPPKMPRVVPRGGMTMQMVQQQQHPAQDSQSFDQPMVEQEYLPPDATGLAIPQLEQEEQ